MNKTEIRYPATKVVHCPSGPANACDEHADAVVKLMAFMGAHVVCTALPAPVECDNCVNEARSRDAERS